MTYKFGDLVQVKGCKEPLVYVYKHIDFDDSYLLVNSDGFTLLKDGADIIGLLKDKREPLKRTVELSKSSLESDHLLSFLLGEELRNYDKADKNARFKITIEEIE